MIVEIDENKIHEMEEDLDNYVKLIKRYDEVVVSKNNAIDELQGELDLAEEIIVHLLKLLQNEVKEDTTKFQILSDILEGLKKKEDEA